MITPRMAYVPPAAKPTPMKIKTNIISLWKLSKAAGINYDKLHRRKLGQVKKSEMEDNDLTKLGNTLMKEVIPFMEELGFEVSIKPLKD